MGCRGGSRHGPPRGRRTEVSGGGPVLECRKIAQRYRVRRGHQIVFEDLDLTITEHQFISLVGASGCGKSTLLRLVLGSEPPWKGALFSNGEPIPHPHRSRGIVFQKDSPFPPRTAGENGEFGLELPHPYPLPEWPRC